MKRFVNNTPINIRIAVLCLIPLLAFVGIGINNLLAEIAKMNKASAIVDVIEVAPAISLLVHELQKERGTSAGFIGSKGKKFSGAIGGRRNDTDKALAKFRTAMARLSGQIETEGFNASLARAQKALQLLSSKRHLVDQFSISVAEMAGYYTPLIANLLSMVESVGGTATNQNMILSFTAYTAFLQGKERAGLERAMGAAGFGSGQFKAGIHRKYVRFAAMQDTFFSVFRLNASKEQNDLYRQALSGSVQGDVSQMRKLAYANPFGSDISSVTGSAWFAASTKRIDALKKVEDKIAADIVIQARMSSSKAKQTFWWLTAFLCGLFALASYISFLIAKSISQPIHSLTQTMRSLARNNTDEAPAGQDRQDEIGQMARAVEIFRTNAINRIKLEMDSQQEREMDAQKQSYIEKIINEFRSVVADTRTSLNEQTEGMLYSAETLHNAASGASSGAGTARNSTQSVSENVQIVATATEQLSASIQEIGAQIERVNETVTSATATASETDKDVTSLSQAVDKIGDVVGLIQDIAEQTNLLALNATIEAARAGHAGKGFAVVAQEVKQLSEQTAKATDEIANQITSVQNSTHGTAKAVRSITKQVRDISHVTSAIAAAVEQQQAATTEISRSVQMTSEETEEAARSVEIVNGAIDETAEQAGKVRSMSDSLTQATQYLSESVEGFLKDVLNDVEDRRAHLRKKMNKAVVISSDGRRSYFTMVDISASGAKLEGGESLKAGDAIAFEFANGKTVEGEVVRTEDGSAGVRFNTQLEDISWLKAA